MKKLKWITIGVVAVASPTGSQAPLMFALDGARVDVSYGQLRQDPMRIEEVVIDEPRLAVEHRGGKLNFQVLMQQDAQPGAEEPDDSRVPWRCALLETAGRSVISLPHGPDAVG